MGTEKEAVFFHILAKQVRQEQEKLALGDLEGEGEEDPLAVLKKLAAQLPLDILSGMCKPRTQAKPCCSMALDCVGLIATVSTSASRRRRASQLLRNTAP